MESIEYLTAATVVVVLGYAYLFTWPDIPRSDEEAVPVEAEEAGQET